MIFSVRSSADGESPETRTQRVRTLFRDCGRWGQRAWPGQSPKSVQTDTRAISSAIAVTLLLGVTVVLALTVVPTVLSLGDEVESPPSADFAFGYTEDVSANTTDSFGTPGTAPGADGLLTITLEEGEQIPPGQLSVSGSVSGGLVSATRPEAEINETMGPGDQITVWVSRGDTVDIVWDAADGGESEILGTYEVQSVETRPPGTPTSDIGCEYIERQTPGDVVIDGVIVVCDLDKYDVDDISIINDGAVVGVVEGDGDIDADSGFTYLGDVTSGADGDDGDIDLDAGSTFNGDVDAEGDLDIDGQSAVNGDVDAEGDVDLDTESSVSGELFSDPGNDSDVTISGASSVGHSITTGGQVDVDSRSTVGGTIWAADAIDVDGDSSVDGRLDNTNGSDSDIDVSGSRITGDIAATGDATVDSNSMVGGPVTAGGAFSVASSNVRGRIDAGGDASFQSSSVAGGAVAGGDIAVQDTTLDGEVDAGGSTTVTGGSTIGGNVTTGGAFGIDSSTVDGAVEAGGDTAVQSGTVAGGIDAGGAVDVDGTSAVEGGITADSSIDLEDDVTVDGTLDNTASGGSDIAVQGGTVSGSIAAAGDLDLDSGSEVGGDISLAGEFDITNVEVGGQIDAGSDVTIQSSTVGTIDAGGALDVSGSTARGPIVSTGDTTVDSSTVGEIDSGGALDLAASTVEGGVVADGDAAIQSGTIEGGVVTDGDLDLTDSIVQGDVTVGGDFSCDNSTINGQSCSAYTSPDSEFVVTITGTNSPIEEGQTLRVDAEIENTGSGDGTRFVALERNGTEQDNRTVALGSGATTTETFTWDTTAGDSGSYTAAVRTNKTRDTEDSTPVQVEVPTANPPTIDRFDTAQRPGKGKSGIEVDWEVSASAAELDTVLLELYDENGVLIDDDQTDASGTTASGSVRFEPLASGRDHEVVLTVTDVAGESKTQSKTQTAG